MLYAAAARAEALEMNRDGRYQESGIRLRLTSEKIAEYAADDPVLGAHIRDLREREHADGIRAHVSRREEAQPQETRSDP